MPCHLRGVPAEIRGERAVCWLRSGIRWTPLDLAGHHLAKSEKVVAEGWLHHCESMVHGWPRNLFGQTETCTIPHFKTIQQPEEPKINCKLQLTSDEINVKWSSLGRHFDQIWLVPMPSYESAWHRSEPWAHRSTRSNTCTCCYCWCKCPANIY